MKRKPLQKPQDQFTVLDNIIMDYLMPTMSGNEFKILMLIIRSTIGWQKEEDQLSYSQIQKRTGIKSKTTIGNCLNSLREKQYIIEIRHNDQWEANTYALNTEFEIDTESVSKNGTVSKNDTMPVSKNGIGPVSKNGHTKESNKTNIKTNSAAFAAPPPPNGQSSEQPSLNGTSGNSPTPPSCAAPPSTSAKKELTPHQQLMKAYQDALGYKIPHGGKEGKGAKLILKAGYTVEQTVACYKSMKRDKFWKRQHLSLMSVYEQLGQFTTNGNGSLTDMDKIWNSIKLAAAQPGKPDISDRALHAVQLVPGGWHRFKSQNANFFDQLRPEFEAAYERANQITPAP